MIAIILILILTLIFVTLYNKRKINDTQYVSYPQFYLENHANNDIYFNKNINSYGSSGFPAPTRPGQGSTPLNGCLQERQCNDYSCKSSNYDPLSSNEMDWNFDDYPLNLVNRATYGDIIPGCYGSPKLGIAYPRKTFIRWPLI
jgi:hypothetical protein